jgi:hypothetical protein
MDEGGWLNIEWNYKHTGKRDEHKGYAGRRYLAS